MFKITNSRYEKLSFLMYKNVVLNYLFRGIAIVAGLFSTKINLSYLGSSLYGEWATIISISTWVNYGDLGIGNGFRNEFSKAVAENDLKRQNELIISASKTLGMLSGILFCGLIIISELLFSFHILNKSIRNPMIITNFFFCIDLYFGIARSIAYGFQKSCFVSLTQSITVVTRIIGILILSLFPCNLLLFAIIMGGAGVFGNIILFFLLNNNIKVVFRENRTCQNDILIAKSIMNLGLKFFVLQLAGLVLYSSDNLIIHSYLGSEAVTNYDIISKIFLTGENLFSIILVSFWSAVTYAYAKKDYIWIKKEIVHIIYAWVFFSVGVIIISAVFNNIVYLWLGKNAITYDWAIISLFALYTIWCSFGSIFVNASNGLGRLKIQLIFSSIEAIINIPLSIFFATNLNMGIFGVKLATLCCCVGANVFVPIDIYIHLKKKIMETSKDES